MPVGDEQLLRGMNQLDLVGRWPHNQIPDERVLAGWREGDRPVRQQSAAGRAKVRWVVATE